ncbi:LamG-like jellyroll fold domain-containing protein [Micromonospora auratinigra]|uniref:Concanavalin A-like lectin/glucanases superfamily protein n=1 Tax=Micromonospora auratinigra TaxID=261654 RepID=A0A1A9A7V8_9ACTN|nr:LamG-like jellyroll fold domain-containing protein [Micromonospora auratinigra]SBT52196.1 Concanavalin A-like lectin/glucanases superfamily protein [Micromonospora auratinigra]
MGRTLSALALGAATLAAAVLVDAGPAYAATEQLRLDFDATPTGQVEPGPWTSGCFADVATPGDSGCIAVNAPGSISRAARSSGTSSSPALAFPAAGSAVVEVPHAANLNPGTQDFTISAMVKLSSAQVTVGANLMQKGYYTEGASSQWKLQVDNGMPGCRIAGYLANGDWGFAKADSDISIADKGWTFVQCKRRGGVLSITVGANPAVTADQNAALDVSNTAKVTVGAKGAGLSNNDQFRGELDNAVLSVG